MIVEYPHVELKDGSPFVAGTAVPVRRIYDWFRRGIPAETLIKRYPALGPAKVLSALAYAHDNRELVERDIEYAERAASAETIPPPQTPLRF
jgi:uncharacterized protein (DUF433 family)